MEFLLDAYGNHYFIEVNPRIQVEHTITEVVTGIDIVQNQILIAQGYSLDSPKIGIKSQRYNPRGYAIECRITCEDASNEFLPSIGRVDVYRTSSGPDKIGRGSGFTGSEIGPYYDNLLVKVTSSSRTFEDAIRKSIRSLTESKISGVKTNVGFLVNVLNHETFIRGKPIPAS